MRPKEPYESRIYVEIDADEAAELVAKGEVRLAEGRSEHATPRRIGVVIDGGAEVAALGAVGRVRSWREQYDRCHSARQWRAVYGGADIAVGGVAR